MGPARPPFAALSVWFRDRSLTEVLDSRENRDRFANDLSPVVRRLVRQDVVRLHLSRAVAEDLMQEVILRIWVMALSGCAPCASGLRAWICRVCHSVILNTAKRLERARRIEAAWSRTRRVVLQASPSPEGEQAEAAAVAELEDDPVEIAVAKERKRAVAWAISQLEQRQRDTLLAWLIQGETLAAIAERHHVSRRTTSREVQEALELLGKLLDRFER